MDIRALTHTPLPVVVDSLLRAFEGYFVPMPKELPVWEQRFGRSGVNWALSYGAFEQDELVAFIIHAIGRAHGRLVAFNTGTGVVPDHRGKRLVDALYVHALPELRQHGVEACTLEVITRNAAAVRVYERIGFRPVHIWRCFLGEPAAMSEREVLHAGELDAVDLGDDRWYSWDHRREALHRNMSGLTLFTLGGTDPGGHVLLDPSTGRIARLGVRDEEDGGQWRGLISALSCFKRPLRLVNVHPERKALLSALLACGFKNDIDQFEMDLSL